MTKNQKVDLLVRMARGERVQLRSAADAAELRKYKVGPTAEYFITKKNMSEYVTACDRGEMRDFYNWCMVNGKGDRRYTYGKQEYLKDIRQNHSLAGLFMGAFSWGILLNGVLGGSVSIVMCCVIGAVIGFVLMNVSRQNSFALNFAVPILLFAVLTYFRMN